MQTNIYRNILFNVDCQLYELYADITHECCMGRLDESQVKWILDTIDSIEEQIHEKSNGRIS